MGLYPRKNTPLFRVARKGHQRRGRLQRRIFRGSDAGTARPRQPVLCSLALVAGLASIGIGCRHAEDAPPTPEQTLMAFSRALGQGRLEQAYALMSAEYRERVSFDAFKRQLTENPQESLAMGNALAHVDGEATQEAVIRYGDDEQLRLTRDGDRWYIATPLVDFYDQRTPRAALRAFIRAMERQRYDVVMRLIPEADKEGITTERMAESWSGEGREEVERMLENLRTHVDAPIEIVGNRATMPYGDRMRVQFVREGEDWKIEDPE